jgi:epoxide hydrolase 4
VAGITVQRLALRSGLTVRALTAGPRDAPSIVLLHGWGVSSYLWRHNILPLAAAGHRVTSIDLPGHGASDAPGSAGAYTLDRFVEHLEAALDALGIERTAIAAQSMAGKVALEFARRSPARVRTLVLFGPVGFGLIPPWQALAPLLPLLPGSVPSLLVPRRVVEFVQHRVYGKLGWFSARDVDEYWAPTQFPDVVRAQLQMLKEFDWSPWESSALADCTVPTQVVFGTRDRTVRPTHAAPLASALPKGRLTWIEDGGHVVMEEVPERINALILDALAAVLLD